MMNSEDIYLNIKKHPYTYSLLAITGTIGLIDTILFYTSHVNSSILLYLTVATSALCSFIAMWIQFFQNPVEAKFIRSTDSEPESIIASERTIVIDNKKKIIEIPEELLTNDKNDEGFFECVISYKALNHPMAVYKKGADPKTVLSLIFDKYCLDDLINNKSIHPSTGKPIEKKDIYTVKIIELPKPIPELRPVF